MIAGLILVSWTPISYWIIGLGFNIIGANPTRANKLIIITSKKS